MGFSTLIKSLWLRACLAPDIIYKNYSLFVCQVFGSISVMLIWNEKDLICLLYDLNFLIIFWDELNRTRRLSSSQNVISKFSPSVYIHASHQTLFCFSPNKCFSPHNKFSPFISLRFWKHFININLNDMCYESYMKTVKLNEKISKEVYFKI